MGLDTFDGKEKMGQIIDLNKKRQERNLPEVTIEEAQKTLRAFAERVIREFEETRDPKDALVQSRLDSVKAYSDRDLDKMLTREIQVPQSHNETYVYAIAKTYKERNELRRQMDHPDV